MKSSIEEMIRTLGLPNRLLTDVEVATFKNCSVQTLRNNRHLGRGLPYVRDGRNIRYSPADIAEDILRNRVDPESSR